jgi:hypothetical protein
MRSHMICFGLFALLAVRNCIFASDVCKYGHPPCQQSHLARPLSTPLTKSHANYEFYLNYCEIIASKINFLVHSGIKYVDGLDFIGLN